MKPFRIHFRPFASGGVPCPSIIQRYLYATHSKDRHRLPPWEVLKLSRAAVEDWRMPSAILYGR